MSATVKQTRSVNFVSGGVENFIVTTTVVLTDPTSLPSVSVFVLTVTDRANPKADTLARVGNIADITTLPTTRDAALAGAAGVGMEFLSPECTVLYTDLTTADAARKVIVQRLNALVEDWNTFSTAFNAPEPSPETIILPSTAYETTSAAALIQAYKIAKQARYAQQQTKTAADAALTAAQNAYIAASNAVSNFSTFISQANSISNEMSTVVGAMSALYGAGNTFFSAASGTPPSSDQKTAFQTALTSANTQISTNANYVGDATTHASALSTYLNTTLTPAQVAAQAALTAAQTAQNTAAATLASDQAAEASALAAVLAVCPDFDSTSICLVSDT